jgi:hypothetical protein
MHDKKGSLILKAVKQNGIYIVNDIAKGLQSVAFTANVHQHPDIPIPAYSQVQANNFTDSLTEPDEASFESKGRSRY